MCGKGLTSDLRYADGPFPDEVSAPGLANVAAAEAGTEVSNAVAHNIGIAQRGNNLTMRDFEIAGASAIGASVPGVSKSMTSYVDKEVAADSQSLSSEADPAVLYHYTTDAGAIGITEDQEITPGKSGAVYLTPDLYGTAEEAEDKLALDQEPTGYFAIPVDLISDLEGPQPVAEKPLGAGNGGGTEYWTQGTIDATDLEFHPFGE
jgi:hypothetical protein